MASTASIRPTMVVNSACRAVRALSIEPITVSRMACPDTSSRIRVSNRPRLIGPTLRPNPRSTPRMPLSMWSFGTPTMNFLAADLGLQRQMLARPEAERLGELGRHVEADRLGVARLGDDLGDLEDMEADAHLRAQWHLK